jgi:hypothetical protein
VVESQPSKLLVAGSIPVSRSILRRFAGVNEAGARSRNPERSLRGICAGLSMAFEQATIKIQNEPEFARLQQAIELAFLPDKAVRFLKQLERKSVRVRDFDGVLTARALEDAAGSPKDFSAGQLYQALPVSDQAQMREFYLSKLEGIDATLRHKFKKLYQYY